MQMNSWVSELLFDCTYSRYLMALIPAGIFKVQYNVECAEHRKKDSSILMDFCLALIS